MFGGIERGSGLGFVKLVESKDAATLLPIIQDFVRLGSIIYSDLWRAYREIGGLPQRVQPLTVNHQINFVNPVNGAHTHKILKANGVALKKL